MQQVPPNPNAPNTQSISNSIDNVGELLKGLKNSVDGVYKGLREETILLEGQLATLNAKMAGTFGQTQKVVAGLRQEAAIAYPAIVGLGGKLVDVENIQLGIAKELGTNVITLGETVSGLYAGAKALGVDSAEIGGVVKGFQDAGVQTEFIRDNMQTTANVARNVGVNTSAVFSIVQTNIKKLNEFGFQNGVEGLAKMASQAAALRINMDSIFGFAERVFDPENAVEMVAGFQRMGVAAGDLADPFRLMYLASEDAGELQNEVVKMTEKFTFFNEKTKQFEVFPNAKRDLREISKQTGISYDDLIKMSTASQKLSMISKDFKLGGIDEESKQFIANVATYSKEKGGFTVKVKGEQKLVSQLNTADLKELKEAQAPVSLEDLARAQLDEAQLATQTLAEIKATLAATAAGSRAPQDFREVIRGVVSSGGAAARESAGNVRGGIKAANEFYENTGNSLISLMKGDGSIKEVANILKTGANDVESGLKKMGAAFSSFDYDKVAKQYISSGNKIAEGASAAYDGITKLGNKAMAALGGNEQTKKPGVEKQTNVNQTTTVDFTPLKVLGDINLNLKNTDGSTTKLTQDQINQLLNSTEFQKTFQRMFSDMQAKGTYGNMPSKVPGG